MEYSGRFGKSFLLGSNLALFPDAIRQAQLKRVEFFGQHRQEFLRKAAISQVAQMDSCHCNPHKGGWVPGGTLGG